MTRSLALDALIATMLIGGLLALVPLICEGIAALGRVVPW